MIWVQLVACFGIILFAGTKLASYGDAISEKTGAGRIWIGVVLIALVTSMPEMATSISSVSLIGEPNLALGNFWGSCMFNLTILFVLDFVFRKGPVLSFASRSNILPAVMGIVLISIIGAGLWAGDGAITFSVGWVGVLPIFIFAVYLFGVYRMFQQTRYQPEEAEEEQYGHMSRRKVFARFAIAAAAIVGGGIWLSFIGDSIADTYNLSASFVGSLFLAIGTSLPELVVAISAVRIGAIDLALGDLLGANMLNNANIMTADLFYTKGPLLDAVSTRNLITAAAVIAMTILVIIGLRFHQRRKLAGVFTPHTFLIFIIYLSASAVLFYY